jgi:hypothetical protein
MIATILMIVGLVIAILMVAFVGVAGLAHH